MGTVNPHFSVNPDDDSDLDGADFDSDSDDDEPLEPTDLHPVEPVQVVNATAPPTWDRIERQRRAERLNSY